MFYENMPLYPGMRPPGEGESCMKMKLFDGGHGEALWPCGGRRPPVEVCERVTVENPRRPGERAEVLLGVDECGNLVICVQRGHCEPCAPKRPCGGFWPDRYDRCDKHDRPDRGDKPVRCRGSKRRAEWEDFH